MRRKLTLLGAALMVAALPVHAQDSEFIGQAAQGDNLNQAAQAVAENREFVPVVDMPELAVPVDAAEKAAWNAVSGTSFAWGSIDTRYSKTAVPGLNPKSTLKETAWRGERVYMQAAAWTKKELHNVKISVSDVKGASFVIAAGNVDAGFERFVMGDCTSADGHGYHPNRDFTQRDSVLVADPVMGTYMKCIEGSTTRPVWISVKVPADAPAGAYCGTVKLTADELAQPLRLAYVINVKNRVLPEPKDWKFHLDLWQNPYSFARYYNVTPWSKEHLDLMRPYMMYLASAGEKVVTTTLMYDCWGPQTLDLFETMVMVTRKLDGTWAYNYEKFDLWVEFMESCGIDGQINCFTIAPWQQRLRYFDMATDTQKFATFDVGNDDYNALWIPLLKDFAKHLREKGWFDKTYIAVDERPEETMKKAIAMAREADPGYKIALAGNYHEGIEADLADYCIGMYGDADFIVKADGAKISERRRAEGKFTTFYTCCGEGNPNTFTVSPLVESAAIGWYALAANYDGYLRWAFNSWNHEPLQDSRWDVFTSGDAFLVYPQALKSVRFDRLIDGIQSFEKVQILREQYKDNPKKLAKLEAAIAAINNEKLKAGEARALVNAAEAELNAL